MYPILKVAGVVHIWYYIPLCTIFAQKYNGEVFRTKFYDSKSRSQNPTPISKEDYSAHQFGNPWWLSEDYSRTPTPWPCRSFGWQLSQDYSKGHSQRLFIIQSVFKAASTSILLGQLHWSIQAAINHTCMSFAQLGQLIFHYGKSITQFNSQDGQNYIGPNQTIQLVIHLPGLAPQRFTYIGHLSSPGDFFPS
ncbi:hypothetical protein O181_125415 [Austropuccinia psidii MF-1]|uniref:Uncharacterized protein n=1 Tax=Austropuccinia psidii MF-1 TaxID=1389203 RepID=A0A9Q3KUU2_9BASI|nr:hypothetical protein [Austropuccinia psidii MF-1]